MESTQDTRSQASYISVAASLTAKLRCCFRGDTTIITGSYNPRGNPRGAQQDAPHGDPHGETPGSQHGDPHEDIPITVALEEAPQEVRLELPSGAQNL